MNNRHIKHCLECWGDYAFFGNSIYGANRRSYEFPTPAAVIGIFESIYWKPCFKWVPDEVQIMRPIKFMTFMRNELRSAGFEMFRKGWFRNFLLGISDKLPKEVFDENGELNEEAFREVVHKEVDKSEMGSYYMGMVRNGYAERVQRCDRILKDVRYRIIAHIEYDPSKETEPGSGYDKHVTIFTRRARKGQCFSQPYFGCREFPAFFRWVDMNDPKMWLKSGDLYEPHQRGVMHYGFKWGDGSGKSLKPTPLDFVPYIVGGRVFFSSVSCQERIDDEVFTTPDDGADAYVAKIRDEIKTKTPKDTEKKEKKPRKARSKKGKESK